MTLTEANAVIERHNRVPVGSGRSSGRAKGKRSRRTFDLLTQACESLRVAPGRLCDVPIERVAAAVARLTNIPAEKVQVPALRACIVDFSANAEPSSEE